MTRLVITRGMRIEVQVAAHAQLLSRIREVENSAQFGELQERIAVEFYGRLMTAQEMVRDMEEILAEHEREVSYGVDVQRTLYLEVAAGWLGAILHNHPFITRDTQAYWVEKSTRKLQP